MVKKKKKYVTSVGGKWNLLYQIISCGAIQITAGCKKTSNAFSPVQRLKT
jgi:hypothetical protein